MNPPQNIKQNWRKESDGQTEVESGLAAAHSFVLSKARTASVASLTVYGLDSVMA